MREVNLDLGLLKLDPARDATVQDRPRQDVTIQEVSTRDMAIIGMAARFPQADSPSAFWENIKSGLDCLRELPEERRQDAEQFFQFKDPAAAPMDYLQCAYLEDVDKFDAEFFRLTPQEARLMSPAQRLALQTAWEAVEDAGYGGQKLHGTATGVYLGFLGDLEGATYKGIIEEVDPESLPLSVAGNLASMIPGRIAYVLNLKGPSVLIDTACSSSLVSVDQACRAIRSGLCDMAIAGGVRLSLLPVDKAHHKIGIESEDNATRAFDHNSSGSGLGEGVGMVVLKPLDKALRDRDSIYAVIKGSAVNQDGTSMGITAPNPVSQEALLVKAWEEAGIDPETLAYIEVHGTGTKLGDTLEMDGLRGAFRRYTDKQQFCALSSVKTNIGHLYESAGIAGLIKAVMALQNQQIPPLLHFQVPNRSIEFQESPVYINTQLRSWEAGETPRRCGVSSFGISGTNCHVVLEEAPAVGASAVREGEQVLPLSARSEAALRALVERYVAYLDATNAHGAQQVDLADICYTAGSGRHHHQHRLAFVASSQQELHDSLTAWLQQAGSAASAGTAFARAATLPGRFFQGVHRVIAEEREVRRTGEITEQEREALNRTARQLVQQPGGTPDDLCQLYVQGADIDWHLLHRHGRPRRLHLPTYPFQATRHWIDIPDQRATVAPESFYHVIWKPEVRPTGATKRTDDAPLLLFKDQQGLGEQLAKRARELGRTVVEVELGTSYRAAGDHRYVISSSADDYHRLVQDLQQVPFTQILHLFSIRDHRGVRSGEELAIAQEAGFYSLFHLTRALIAAGIERELDIVLIGEQAQAVTGEEQALHPEHATLFGFGKVVRKEHPHLHCRCLDLDALTAIDDIWAELSAADTRYKVAFRAGRRYVEEFTALDLEATPERPIELRNGGVYVITGGTGGIGLEVARSLARQRPLHLALLNRSTLPPRAEWAALVQAGTDAGTAQKLRDLLEIEALGATVHCFSADVADRDSLHRALEAVRTTLGPINGVIHGAGVGAAVDIVKRDLPGLQAVFNPKVQGTYYLDELTRTDPLDFLILFSSIATMFGATGQGDYAAANAYLDAYAGYRNQQGLRTLTINWSTWRERGMAAGSGFAIDALFKAMATDTALTGFAAVLQRDVANVLIGELHYDWAHIASLADYQLPLAPAIQARIERRRTHQRPQRQTRPAVSSGPVKLVGREQESYSDVEQKLAEICKQTLGIEELNVFDSFFELGADSILLKKMHAEIEKVFPGQVAVADVFAYPTLAKLSQFLLAPTASAPVTKKEAKKEPKPAAATHLEVSDLLGQMEGGELSVDQLVDKLFDL